MKNKYNNNVELIYSDTDSFIIHVETDDIYKDMLKDKNLYDFSEYPTNHPNYDTINKKALMKYKDELKSKIIIEFIRLKPKMNSFNYVDNNIIMNKYEYDEYDNIILEGDKRIVLKYDKYNNIIVNKNSHKDIKKSICLKHDEYKRALYKEQLIYKKFYDLQLNKQNMYLDKINKIALNPFDSKRYWIDNVNSLPFGYEE